MPIASPKDIKRIKEQINVMPGFWEFMESEASSVYAAQRVNDYFSGLGYATETAGLYIWDNIYQKAPGNHMAVRIWRDPRSPSTSSAKFHQPVVIDLTAGQFSGVQDRGNFFRPLVVPEQEWLERLSRFPRLENRLVSHQWFKTQAEATHAYSSPNFNVPVYESGYPKTVQPDWYKSAERESLFAKVRKRHGEEAERHILEAENERLQQMGDERWWVDSRLRPDFAGLSAAALYSSKRFFTQPMIAELLHSQFNVTSLHDTLHKQGIVFAGIDLRSLAELSGSDMLAVSGLLANQRQAGIEAWPLDRLDEAVRLAQASANWSSRLERARKAGLDAESIRLDRSREKQPYHRLEVELARTASKKRLDVFGQSAVFQAGQDLHVPLLLALRLPREPELIRRTDAGAYRIPMHVHKPDIRFVVAPADVADEMQRFFDTLSPARLIPVLGAGEAHSEGVSATQPPRAASANGLGQTQPGAGTPTRAPTETSATPSLTGDTVPALLPLPERRSGPSSTTMAPRAPIDVRSRHAGLHELAEIRQRVTQDPACRALIGTETDRSDEAVRAVVNALHEMNHPTKIRQLVVTDTTLIFEPIEYQIVLLPYGDRTVVVDLMFGQFTDDNSIDGVAVEYEESWIRNLIYSNVFFTKNLRVYYQDYAGFSATPDEKKQRWRELRIAGD